MSLCDSVVNCCCLKPFTPKRDQYSVSPLSVTVESHIEGMRIKEMIANQRNSGLLNNFLLSMPLGNV